MWFQQDDARRHGAMEMFRKKFRGRLISRRGYIPRLPLAPPTEQRVTLSCGVTQNRKFITTRATNLRRIEERDRMSGEKISWTRRRDGLVSRVPAFQLMGVV